MKSFIIDCSSISENFKDIFIEIESEDLEKLLDIMKNLNALFFFKNIRKNIFNYDRISILKEKEINSKKWKNFCNDIVIYNISKIIIEAEINV